jgi:D-serine deaminase-like pyridoxal phosphate-dependent protein
MTDAWLDAEARADFDTPLVVVNLDRLRANIERMAALMRERGIALRPHAKTHKSLEVARRQIAAGAVGLTVATVGEAEVFADGGIDDLFIAYPVHAAGPRAERLRWLASRCRLSLGADSVEGIERLAAAFRGIDAVPRVLIEIDSQPRGERRVPGRRRRQDPGQGQGALRAGPWFRAGLSRCGVIAGQRPPRDRGGARRGSAAGHRRGGLDRAQPRLPGGQPRRRARRRAGGQVVDRWSVDARGRNS